MITAPICSPPTFMWTFGQVASSVMQVFHSASLLASAKQRGPAIPPLVLGAQRHGPWSTQTTCHAGRRKQHGQFEAAVSEL
jgi:hypothetical protein